MHSGKHYTCECDGYVSFYVAKGAQARTVYIYDSEDTLITTYNPISFHASVDQVSQPFFVPKGCKIAFNDSTDVYWGYTSLYWRPIG